MGRCGWYRLRGSGQGCPVVGVATTLTAPEKVCEVARGLSEE